MENVSMDVQHNLHMLKIYPNWYEHLPKVEAAMAEESRIGTARYDAGWDGDEGGSFSPDGIHEDDWHEMDRPFPEDEEAYVSWFASNNPPGANPYPKRQARLDSQRRSQELLRKLREERNQGVS